MICTRCKKEKHESLFAVDNDKSSGRRSECKACKNRRQRETKAYRVEREKRQALEQAAREEIRRKTMNVALPRTFTNMNSTYVPEPSYARNDGLKHIQSRGV